MRSSAALASASWRSEAGGGERDLRLVLAKSPRPQGDFPRGPQALLAVKSACSKKIYAAHLGPPRAVVRNPFRFSASSPTTAHRFLLSGSHTVGSSSEYRGVASVPPGRGDFGLRRRAPGSPRSSTLSLLAPARSLRRLLGLYPLQQGRAHPRTRRSATARSLAPDLVAQQQGAPLGARPVHVELHLGRRCVLTLEST